MTQETLRVYAPLSSEQSHVTFNVLAQYAGVDPVRLQSVAEAMRTMDPDWQFLGIGSKSHVVLYKRPVSIVHRSPNTHVLVGDIGNIGISEPFESVIARISASDKPGYTSSALQSIGDNMQTGGSFCIAVQRSAADFQTRSSVIEKPQIVQQAHRYGLEVINYTATPDDSTVILQGRKQRSAHDLVRCGVGTQAAHLHTVNPRALWTQTETIGEWTMENGDDGKLIRGAYAMERWGSSYEFEQTMAMLEDGRFAHSSSSGRSAVDLVLLALLEKGDALAVLGNLNGATEEFISDERSILRDRELRVHRLSPHQGENADWIPTNTKMILLETPSNPLLEIADIQKIASAAHKIGARVVVDNTFMTPYCQKPLRLGADISVASASKYLGGHLVTAGGIIVWNDDAINKPLLKASRMLGAVLSPQQAVELNTGMQSLGSRMERHASNALMLATTLESQGIPVLYPGLPSHPQYELAQRQQQCRGGGILLADFGSEGRARDFIRRLRIPRMAVSFGGPQTLVELPYHMTHGNMSPLQKAELGIIPSHVRISAGLEETHDLVHDIARAARDSI